MTSIPVNTILAFNMGTAPVRDNTMTYLQFMKPFEVRVILANEERMMAMHARAIVAPAIST